MAEIAVLPKRQRNQRGEGGRLREEVIEAAMRLLDRTPAASLSLRMVAREAGVAAPSLYRQFADADAMMREIIGECWRQVGVAMLTAEMAAADRPALARLQAQMGGFVRYAMQRPSRYGLLFALAVGWEHELGGPLRPAYRLVLETIERHVREGGHLATADPVSAAILTLSMTHGRIAIAHLAPARAGNSVDEVEKFVRETLAHLFAPRARCDLHARAPKANGR